MVPVYLYKNLTVYRLVTASLVAVLNWGCAGPSTPFGALSPFSTENDEVTLTEDKTSQGVEIEISPRHKVFHKAQKVRVTIRDPEGISKTSQYRILYNQKDVTDAFKLVNSTQRNSTELHLMFDNLRLPPRKVHDIVVTYRRSPGDPRVHKISMKNPTCSHQKSRTIASTLDFPVDDRTIHTIEEVSLSHQMNPSLLAALTAQESGFNPRAVSTYKALGLTQMTHIAEEEIIEDVNEWPRYPGIRKLNFAQLKYHILTNQINKSNEWRLNPKLSLIGGTKYINILEKYWAREDKQKLLAESGGDLTRVILASYNIGPATVSRAISRQGKNWLKDKEGKSATKYVNMVTSYCQEFAGTQL